MARTKIIYDTDPGVDDVMAFFLASHSPELEIVGLTTIFGNADVEYTTRNALRLVELEGNTHIPVARGAGRPLVNPYKSLGTFHGMDGFGYADLPLPSTSPIQKPAAQFIVDMLKQYPGQITLVPVGPLTNLALALHLEPGIIHLVKEVVIMGGAAFVPGNASPVAEANIFHDPHAAADVFSAGWPLTMVGLDVTTKCIMSKEYLDGMARIDNPANRLIAKIIPVYQDAYERFDHLHGGIHTHDPSAIAYVIDPTLFRTLRAPIYVETLGRCFGKTVPDVNRRWIDGPETNICMEVDSPRLLGLYRERLSYGA
jgi:purine nucleosidase